MATQPYIDCSLPEVRIIRWDLSDVDEGSPIQIATFNDKSYGVWGIWGSATCVLQGSWDTDSPPGAMTWIPLKESDNTTAISNSANACGVVLENPIWLRPVTTGGTGTSISLVLVAR